MRTISQRLTVTALTSALAGVSLFAALAHVRATSASEADIHAEVANTLAELTGVPTDVDLPVTVHFVVRASHPPSNATRWFWHVAFSCPGCTQDEDNPFREVASTVHETSGWAVSRKAAQRAALAAFRE